jgi:hypothetical protein
MERIINQDRVKLKGGLYSAAEIAAAPTRTATVGGATTGVIAATDKVVAALGVTGQTGYLLTLPTPVVGKSLLLLGNAFAYKVQTNTNTVGIDGITGTPATLTVAARTVVELVCTSATNWQVVKGGSAGAIA